MSEYGPNKAEQTDNHLTDVDKEELEKLHQKSESDLSDKEVTSKVKYSIKKKFDYPTWLLVFEFQNRDGKRADCLALNTTPSRGFKLVGFEFKASRSDWLNEKRDHEKADYFVQLCDEWYVVAGRRGIVEEKELPQGWGLLELKPKGALWNLVESDLNELQNTDLDRRFFARFMRKALGKESNFDYSDIREAERRGYQKAKDKSVDEHLDYEIERLREKAQSYDRLRESGLNLDFSSLSEDRIERLENAQWLLKQVEENNYGNLVSELEHLEKDVDRHLTEMQDTANEMREQLETIKDSLDGETND